MPSEPPAQREGEQLLSRLLMGFVERKVSPRTIIDVVSSQIFEFQIEVSDLQTSTCNGVLEILPAAGVIHNCIEILHFFSRHSAFPHYLSLGATLNSMQAALAHGLGFLKTAPSDGVFAYEKILEGLIDRSFALLDELSHSPRKKELAKSLEWALATLPLTQKVSSLLSALLTATKEEEIVRRSNEEQKPEIVVESICRTPEIILQNQALEDFRLAQKFLNDGWKIKNLAKLARIEGSEAHLQFLGEWFFESALHNLVFHKIPVQDWAQNLKIILSNDTTFLPLFKGMMKSFQKEIPFLLDAEGNLKIEVRPYINSFFLNFLSHCENESSVFLKQAVPWAITYSQLFADKERLITRNQVLWLKTISRKIWQEGLTDLPHWVRENSPKYAAVLFKLAPSFWLQTYSHLVIQKLYSESLLPQFVVSSGHLDYMEFLIRTLKKRSPYFATCPEILESLSVLKRLSRNEENDWELARTRTRLNTRVASHLENAPLRKDEHMNQVARALSILLRPAKEISGQNPIQKYLNKN